MDTELGASTDCWIPQMPAADVDLGAFPETEGRYVLGEELGRGVFGRVVVGLDGRAADRKVAVKILENAEEYRDFIRQEYVVLREFSEHLNLPDFYGVFKCDQQNEIWFVMELAEAGTVVDLSRGLLKRNRRMAEEHVAFALKETIKGLLYLHRNHVIHRDVKGSNILLTKEGEIKLVDFGFSCSKDTNSVERLCVGSPAWMAPEVATCQTYDDRVDVWSLGITAIEIGDGKAPLQDMHPSRAVFQVARNPPPTLYRPSNWSDIYNDLIEECLAKNFEYRPYMEELLQHPFIETVPENSYHLSQELKTLSAEYSQLGRENREAEEVLLDSKTLKVSKEQPPELMVAEDLASLDELSDTAVLNELQKRFEKKEHQTFIGDILMIINPYETCNIYGEEYHRKYMLKSRSENAPHVYALADGAYQYTLHHKNIQQILLSGETSSGKTTNYFHIVDHLLYLGRNPNVSSGRITNAIKLVQSLVSGSTAYNTNSTRCLLRTELTYGRTGKVSGALFGAHLLEKFRVSSVDMPQGNFHILYYFYDGMATEDANLRKYYLQPDRAHRYLRITEGEKGPRCDPGTNVEKFREIQGILEDSGFSDEQIETIYKVLASILVLGEIKFKECSGESAEVADEDQAEKVALLLGVDPKKLSWALTNYCLINKGVAVRKQHTCDEARSARDVLANNLYSRLVDYIIAVLNHKLSYGRAIFGDNYSIRITDLFGFECSKTNMLSELLTNCLNEQLHYFYLQKVFAWEALDLADDEIEFTPFAFYDNKATLERILKKPDGLVSLIDDASKKRSDGRYVTENLRNFEKNEINAAGLTEFSIAHYTGTVVYDAKEMPDKNRDFLPPEVIEVLRSSENPAVRALFTGKLNKMGNLTLHFEEETVKRKIISSSSSSEDENKELVHQYSQIKKMRTVAATFKAVSLDLLKELSIGGSSGGTHFVRCVRSNLENSAWSFNSEIVKQQIKALAVTETAKERQNGYPYRISFPEFLRRYQFLAFGFDEHVDITKDNCRLLLVRLKLQGWCLGKTKVFLKYFNEEYLSRAYETKVTKVIKTQSIIRSYLVKRRLMKNEVNNIPTIPQSPEVESREDQAARVIQKAFKELSVKKALNEPYEDLDKETKEFIRFYCKKWKAKSIFQVLLQYRAARYQDLFSFSQQVHLYNQNVINYLDQINIEINIDVVDEKANCCSWIGDQKPAVLKVPFRLDEIPYYDTAYLCDPLTNTGTAIPEEEPWDSPFQWHSSCSNSTPAANAPSALVELPYTRDPSAELPKLPPSPQPTPKSPPPQSPPKTPPKSPTKDPEEDVNFRNRLLSETNCNSTLANKDFEFIKPPPLPAKRRVVEEANPINELKMLGRRDSTGCEDDPPFNFQKMLRKTNFKRDSLKRSVEVVVTNGKVEVSNGVKGEHREEVEEVVTDGKKEAEEVIKDGNGDVIVENGNLNDGVENGVNGSCNELFSGEIMPGVFLEGVVIDL